MHYRGFAIVSEPTDEAVAAAMKPHEEGYDEINDDCFGHWDWYRCGGRHDGYLVSDAEMHARKTHGGFNFDPKNRSVARNCCRSYDVPADRRSVYFFVSDGAWIESETYNRSSGDFEETPGFAGLLDAALASHPDHWVVVIDAHS